MGSARRLGERAWRIDRPAGVAARVLLERVRAWDGVVDAVVTENHLAAYFSSDRAIDEAAIRALGEPAPKASRAPREHALPVVYDGPDLEEVARTIGATPRELVDLHARGTYEVAMVGFQPGFAYLSGLDARLVLPRRSSPRTRVPAGSVAIGGPYTGVYPFTSPGGWNLIGRTIARVFDAERGALFALGDRVRFVEHK